MLRRRRRSRHRQDGSVSPVVAPTWAIRLFLLVLAIGLVVMHHLVGAHQHAMPGTAAGVVSDGSSPVVPASSTAMTGTAPGHAHAAAPAELPHEMASPGPHPVAAMTDTPLDAPGPTAPLHGHPDGDGHDVTMLWHLCLAVLLGMALTVVLALVASWWQAIASRRATAGTALTSVPRAPPVPLRLAQLQVLRL